MLAALEDVRTPIHQGRRSAGLKTALSSILTEDRLAPAQKFTMRLRISPSTFAS